MYLSGSREAPANNIAASVDCGSPTSRSTKGSEVSQPGACRPTSCTSALSGNQAVGGNLVPFVDGDGVRNPSKASNINHPGFGRGAAWPSPAVAGLAARALILGRRVLVLLIGVTVCFTWIARPPALELARAPRSSRRGRAPQDHFPAGAAPRLRSRVFACLISVQWREPMRVDQPRDQALERADPGRLVAQHRASVPAVARHRASVRLRVSPTVP
jgi:hypothetical protein